MTDLFQVAFIYGCRYYGGEPKILESYFFDSEKDALECQVALARQRLEDTRNEEKASFNLKVLKRRHRSLQDREQYIANGFTEISNQFPANLSFKPKSFEQKFEWGGDCESGPVFSVVIIKHQFYERYDISSITPKTVHDIRELMHN